jgi:hypothetical protein
MCVGSHARSRCTTLSLLYLLEYSGVHMLHTCTLYMHVATSATSRTKAGTASVSTLNLAVPVPRCELSTEDSPVSSPFVVSYSFTSHRHAGASPCDASAVEAAGCRRVIRKTSSKCPWTSTSGMFFYTTTLVSLGIPIVFLFIISIFRNQRHPNRKVTHPCPHVPPPRAHP